MKPSEESRARNRRARDLLQTSAEVREGGFRDDGLLDTDGLEVRLVAFSLSKNAALSRGLLLDGEFYVRALDAATLDGRDRNRLLAIAKVVANNA